MQYRKRNYRKPVGKPMSRSGRRLRQSTVTIPGGRVNVSGVDPTGYFKAFRAVDRARQGMRSRLRQRVKRVKNREEQGGYQQFSNEASTFGKVLRTNIKNRKLLSAAKESYIFSFKGIKTFDDNGTYFLRNAYNEFDRNFPVFALLLNGRNLPGVSPTVAPLRSLYSGVSGAGDGQLQWRNENGIEQTVGTLTNPYLVTEYSPERQINPTGQKLFWDWSEIKLNLWGARNKAVKYTIQIVKVLEDSLSPWHLTSGSPMGTESQQHWEQSLKQYCFNPLAKLNYEGRPKIKVLKSWDRIIQPTSSTENDADPHVHILKWFSRWNRVVNYDRIVESTNASGARFRTPDDQDYNSMVETTQYTQIPYSHYPSEKEQVFLLIRASCYTNQLYSSVSNATCGSFDVSMRTKFTVLD